MIVLYWKVRGFGNSETKVALTNLYVSHKPVFIFVAERMINFSHVPSWFLLRNRWHNARSLNVHFREGNKCANRLANMGHSVVGEVWLSNFNMIFMRYGVVYLSLDCCRWLLFWLFLSFVCFCWFSIFFPSVLA